MASRVGNRKTTRPVSGELSVGVAQERDAGRSVLPDNIARFEPKIEHRRVDELRPNKRNPRTHSRKQQRLIAKSIRQFGFTNPIGIDDNDTVVYGHGRLAAAELLGMALVPTIRLSHLTRDELRALTIADNQLAALAGWDDEMLAIELKYLVEVNFDVELVGFEAPEIDHLIETQLTGPGSDLADAVPDIDEDKPPVSRLGDPWLLGVHRLLCGNALDACAVATLMAETTADMVITDPPFNVKIDGHVCGSGSIKHDDFMMASGEMPDEEFESFLATALSRLRDASRDGSIHFVFMDWRHIELLLAAGRLVYSDLLNICVWNKTNAGMGSLYRSQHEFICMFKSGTGTHINNVQLGRYGRNRSNVWTYAGVNSFRTGRLEELSMHPTVKPVALIADAIRDCSKRGGIVLDIFAGSGTTIMAAVETGRIGYAMELDPRYVDVAVRRWEKCTGGAARHAVTGLTFAEMTSIRRSEVPLLTAPPIEPAEEV
jgi:DNA modification methylase